MVETVAMQQLRHTHRATYEANADLWDSARSRRLLEKPWLDRLQAHAPPGSDVLDLGCGTGDPIARYLIERGCRVTGVDFATTMLAIARRRFPAQTWLETDMRLLDLGRRFAGIVAWDSFFHLTRDEQRDLLPRLAAHLAPGGALLVTVGPDEGEAVGRVGTSEVYHASLSPAEYARRLGTVGIEVAGFVASDPACAGHSVLLAVHRAPTGRIDRATSIP